MVRLSKDFLDFLCDISLLILLYNIKELFIYVFFVYKEEVVQSDVIRKVCVLSICIYVIVFEVKRY